MNTIVIEVRGGVVQEVYAEDGTRIVLVDWDECEEAGLRPLAVDVNPLPLHVMPEEAEQFIASTK